MQIKEFADFTGASVRTPLKSIGEILSSPHYDKDKALKAQKQLLVLKKERLERLIDAIDSAAKGEPIMKAFDNSEFETYKAETKERWGKTEAYKDYTERTKNYGKDKWSGIVADMDVILGEFAFCMKKGSAPGAEETQCLVKKLKNHITENYYSCTKDILAGLGQMYVADERFKNNIDKHADGTAEFISEAIAIYCQKQ